MIEINFNISLKYKNFKYLFITDNVQYIFIAIDEKALSSHQFICCESNSHVYCLVYVSLYQLSMEALLIYESRYECQNIFGNV